MMWPTKFQDQFDQSVKTINDALAPSKFSLRVVSSDAAEPNIKFFYIRDHSEFTRVAQWYWLRDPAQEYTWDMHWDAYSRLKDGYVIVSTQNADADTVRYRTLRGLLGVLGFNNWSAAIPDSFFSGRPRTLTATDRCLISFFYSHVSPHAQAWELRNAFDHYWNK
jgi:hypothetical protein